MKTINGFKLLMVIVSIMLLSENSNAQSVVTVLPNTEYQTIEGWGVSMAWWANLAGGMGQPIIDELAGYAVNDLNLNVFRFNIGGGENPNCTAGDHIRKDGGKMPGYRSMQLDNQGWGVNNYTNDARQIAVMDKIASLRESKGDIITEMISYSPPWWMTHSECVAGNVSATSENLKPEFVDDFADYLVSVTAGLKNAHPLWNISYIEPFNEPLSGYWSKGGNQEGSAIYEATQAQVLWRLWQSQSTYNVASLGLAAADNSQVTTALTNVTNLRNNNPGEYNGLAKINTHSYGGNWQDKANLATFAKNNGNKPIWQTETGPLSWNLPPGQTDWWIRHYDMAYRLVEDLRNLQSTVWCDWQLMSIDDGWGMIQQTNWDENNPFKTPTLKKTRGFYCRKNVTNFIKAGYKIISTSNGNTLAALSPDKNELVFVVVNSSNIVNDYAIDLNNFPTISSFKTYRTSGGDSSIENTTEKTTPSVTQKGVLSAKTLSYTAPAYSVTTFVVNIGGSLSNSKFKNNGLKIYPNPFSTRITFEFETQITNGSLVMYDGLGREVKRVEHIQNKSLTVDRGGLLSGVYFYKLIQDKAVLAQGCLIAN